MSESIDKEPNMSEITRIFKQEFDLQYQRREGLINPDERVKEETDLGELRQIAAGFPKQYLRLADLEVGTFPSPDVIEEDGVLITEAFLPMTSECMDYSDLEPYEFKRYLMNQSFFPMLITYQTHDNFTVNNQGNRGYYFDLLPEEFKKDVSEGGCTFKTKKPSSEERYSYYEWYYQQRNLARRNLMKLLGITE